MLFTPVFLAVRKWQNLRKRFSKGEKEAVQPCLNHEQVQKDFILTAVVNSSNVYNIACKDLSHLTCLNIDKKGHNITKYLKPKRKALED